MQFPCGHPFAFYFAWFVNSIWLWLTTSDLKLCFFVANSEIFEIWCHGWCLCHKSNFEYLRIYLAGNPTCYLLVNEVLQELHWFKQPYSSWFLGDYVSEGRCLTSVTLKILKFAYMKILSLLSVSLVLPRYLLGICISCSSRNVIYLLPAKYIHIYEVSCCDSLIFGNFSLIMWLAENFKLKLLWFSRRLFYELP